MNRHELKYLILSDLYRHTADLSFRSFLKAYLLIPGFKLSFWYRLTRYFHQHPFFRRTLFYLSLFIQLQITYRYGINVDYNARIGPGFYIGHFGGIFVHGKAVIGRNCNISQQVTIGQSNRGEKRGVPVIGDNVYIGPGAKLFGNIHVGSGSAIGANCVLGHDVPENAVVLGIPGRVISREGSTGYITQTDYDRILKPEGAARTEVRLAGPEV